MPGAPRIAHTLAVGGTGMLRGAVSVLADDASVTVIARTPARLRAIERGRPGRIAGVEGDWRDPGAFVAAITAAMAERGPIERCVAWFHDDGMASFDVLVDALRRGATSVDFLHVLGSAADMPSRSLARRFVGDVRVRYREVVLGFVIEDGRSRWLTDAEICAGVINAVRTGAAWSVVGVVEPWSSRP